MEKSRRTLCLRMKQSWAVRIIRVRKERPEGNGECLAPASASPFSALGRGNAQSAHPAKECIQVKELGNHQENDTKSNSFPRVLEGCRQEFQAERDLGGIRK